LEGIVQAVRSFRHAQLSKGPNPAQRGILLTLFVFLLMCSSRADAQWGKLVSAPQNNSTLVYFGGSLLSATPEGVAQSADEGATWKLRTSGFSKDSLGRLFLQKMHPTQKGIFVSSFLDSGYIYRSTDTAQTWSPVLSGKMIWSFCSTQEAVYALGSSFILKSTDNGEHWSQTSDSTASMMVIAAKDQSLFSAGAAGILRSTNDGRNWTRTSITELMISFAVTDSEIFAGSDFGAVYRSTDDGGSWTRGDLDSVFNSVLLPAGEMIYEGTERGVYGSPDRGRHWRFVGLATTDFFHPLAPATALAISPVHLFAVNETGTEIWSRPLSTLSVQPKAPPLPVRSALIGSYPNPFNGETTILYHVAERSRVTITIYDALGRGFGRIADGEMNPGDYRVRWKAGTAASGVYFVRMVSGRATSTARIIAVK
jgi:outer membrane protein assembly factor BamB